MKEIAKHPVQRSERHLLSPRASTGSSDSGIKADLTRSHGQGNGLRVHGLYFAGVAFVALVLVVVGIVIATR